MNGKTIKQVATELGITENSIRKCLSRHKDLFEGHTNQDNGKVELDEEAVKIIEEKRTYKTVVVYEENEETRELKETINKQQQIIMELQQQLINEKEAAKQLIETNTKNKLLLELDQRQKEQLEKELAAANNKIVESEIEIKSYKKTFLGLYKKV